MPSSPPSRDISTSEPLLQPVPTTLPACRALPVKVSTITAQDLAYSAVTQGLCRSRAPITDDSSRCTKSANCANSLSLNVLKIPSSMPVTVFLMRSTSLNPSGVKRRSFARRSLPSSDRSISPLVIRLSISRTKDGPSMPREAARSFWRMSSPRICRWRRGRHVASVRPEDWNSASSILRQ